MSTELSEVKLDIKEVKTVVDALQKGINNLEKTFAVMSNEFTHSSEQQKATAKTVTDWVQTSDLRYASKSDVSALDLRVQKLEGARDGIINWLLSHIAEIALGAVSITLVAERLSK